MGQKGHIMVQKGLKMHKKRQKIEFLDLKRRFFSLAELGGTPRSLKSTHTAHMCGGPKKVGGTKKLVDFFFMYSL